MKFHTSTFLAALLGCSFIFAGCSTTEGRIKSHQAAFDSAPAPVQAKIRAGQIDVGFTQEQVTMAIGKPDRSYTRTTARGTAEIWAYADDTPSFSIGVGAIGGGGGTMVGSGVSVGSGGDRHDDKVRVIFEGGRVTAIETRGRR